MTSDVAAATSQQGKVLEWNPPMAKLVCMSADKAIDHDVSSLCYQCDKQDVEDMLARHAYPFAAHRVFSSALSRVCLGV